MGRVGLGDLVLIKDFISEGKIGIAIVTDVSLTYKVGGSVGVFLINKENEEAIKIGGQRWAFPEHSLHILAKANYDRASINRRLGRLSKGTKLNPGFLLEAVECKLKEKDNEMD